MDQWAPVSLQPEAGHHAQGQGDCLQGAGLGEEMGFPTVPNGPRVGRATGPGTGYRNNLALPGAGLSNGVVSDPGSPALK